MHASLAIAPLTAALLISALVPSQDETKAVSEERALELALAARVSDERARDAVRELVRFGPRMGGTASGHAAAAWLAERFEELGLATEVVEDDEKWCHAESSWSLVAHVTGADGSAQAVALEDCWPYGFSPSAAGRAPLSLDPSEGAALLSERQTRPRRGSASPALVLIDGSVTSDGRYPKVRSLRAGDGNAFPVFGITTADGERLRAWLEAELDVQIGFTIEAEVVRARPRTVVATLPGREGAPPGHLLFCAHGDSDAGGPGANDNASGEAVVLEIARAWSEALKAGDVEPPPREVRFAVWGSEIFSTRGYLERHETGSNPVLAVINYDQAGFGSGAEQLNVEPDDLPANRGFVLTAGALLSELAGEPGLPARWATNKSLGGTDSYVFSGSKTFRSDGRPSVTLFTSAWDAPAEHERTEGMPGESWSTRELVNVDYDVYYHSAGDTPENTTDLEPHNLGWCARVGLLIGRRWLNGLE